MSFPGYINSDNLAMLTSVLDEIFGEQGCGLGPEREAAAARIIDLFLSGLSDRFELLSALRGEEPARRVG